MGLCRFYQNLPLVIGDSINLDEAVSNHIHRVLRLNNNQQVQLFNGDGYHYLAVISNSAKTVSVNILDRTDPNNESPLQIHLGQAISKGQRMDFTLQKSVELGISSITPIISERVQFRFDEKRTEKKMTHWRNIIISACEQSGRATIPELNQPQTIEQWLSVSELPSYIFTPNSDVGLMDLDIQPALRLLVGPEGGLSDCEINLFLTSPMVTALHLGPRILRTETAALTAISILQARFGDL